MNAKYFYLFFIFQLLCLSKLAVAQEINKGEEIENHTSSLVEEVTLFTDRSIYSIGEEVLFKAICKNDIASAKTLSSVIYVELIKPDGTSIVQLKFPLKEGRINGKIPIPANLATGIYFLKAYTKWMRNSTPESYGYQQIKIVNPANPAVSQVTDGQTNTLNFMHVQELTHLDLTTNKDSYSIREKVNVSFQLDDNINDKSLCVSVVKRGAKDLSKSWIKNKESKGSNNVPVVFYPETDGVTISGKVWDNSHNQPVSDALISLALLSNTSYFFSSNSNKEGEFFLTLPDKKQVSDFYINAEKEDMKLNIEIDNDFCTKPVSLHTDKFSLSELERELATEICVNAQITQVFANQNDSNYIDQNSTPVLSFYGTPQKTFFTKDYINLQTLHDFITEVVREVKVSKNKLVPSINSSQNNSFKSLPYLVLIDNIPVSDQKAFVEISTNKIERIELINHAYVVGNKKYCGVVSAFSKNNDLAGIELPPNSMFFKYAMLEAATEMTVIDQKKVENTHFPDRRNCLYWNPAVEVVAGEAYQFSFYTNDVPGAYQIIVQAISKNEGTPVVYESNFIVE